MKKLIDFIKHHQVIAFFVITFTITWGLGFTFDAVMNQGKYLLAPLTFVALCGPALAGIIVTGITDTQPLSEKGKASWIAFFVALCLVTLVFLANNTFINHAPFSPLLTVFIMVSAIPVAFAPISGISASSICLARCSGNVVSDLPFQSALYPAQADGDVIGNFHQDLLNLASIHRI